MEKNDRVLVVGGSGFIGRSLCQTLTNLKISAINFSNNNEDVDCYENIHGDITDKACLELIFNKHSIYSVVNLASLLYSDSIKNPIKATRIGVEGSINLFELSKKHNVKRFISASSTCLLRPSLDIRKGVSEDATVFTDSIYEEIKRFVEEIGVRISLTCGFEFISSRISLVVGPGHPSSTSAYRTEIFNRLVSGGEIHIPFQKDEVLPISHYEDVAQSLVLLLKAPKLEHTIYNMPCESWKVSDLADLIRRIGKDVKVTIGNHLFLNGAPYIDWGRIRNELGAKIVPLEERMLEFENKI